jgi:O-methyltransferase involved in polyketide biosynthesis
MGILFYMQDGKASRTAQYMAFFRALETQERPARRLFNDPYAFVLLSGPLRMFARLARFPVLPVDFERDNLEAKLTEAGYDPASPAVVVWEGVISYLTEAAVESTFALLSRLLAPGSCLIFTYMHKGVVDGSRTFPGVGRWRSWVSFNGEPFINGLDPDTLSDILRPLGFLLRSDISTEDIAHCYCPPLGRKEPGSPAYHVATAGRVEM